MIKFLNSGLYPVKNPKFNVGQDAGIDMYVPEYNETFMAKLIEKNPKMPITVLNREATRKNEKGEEEKYTQYYFMLNPQEGVNIPSGMYTSIPADVALTGFNKSGVSTKKLFMVGACVDDHAYQGILHLHVINCGHEPQEIIFDERLVQFVPVKIDISGVEVSENMTPEEFFEGVKTERGDGGFGSTGTN